MAVLKPIPEAKNIDREQWIQMYEQMVNQAAKIHYMSGGKLTVPMVL